MSQTRRIVLALAVAASASSAFATNYSTICPPAAGEKSTKQILQQLIGGSWSASGVNFTNGTVTATRVKDSGVSGPLSLLGSAGSNDDQTFSGGPITARARAVYASHDSTFGWIDSTVSGNTFKPLMNTRNFTTDVTFTGSSDFRFALKNNTQNAIFSSRVSDNYDVDFCDPKDHMITYKLSGAGIAANTWLLFWEDLRGLGDCDYNDAVIQITVIPAPGAAALAGIGGLLVAKRRRR